MSCKFREEINMLSLIRALAFSSVFCAVLLTACAQNRQNGGVPTPQAPGRSGTGTGTGDSGILQGTINGGGGRGIRCAVNGKETFESLDLFEAKAIGLKLIDPPATEEAAIDLAIELLAKHMWTPSTIPVQEFAAVLKKELRTKWLSKVRYLDGSKSLRMVNDSHEVILQEGCKAEQVALYYEASILVNKKLYDQFDNLSKAALWLHELVYYIERLGGRTDSISSRLLVGQMFSKEGARPKADGIPPSPSQHVVCGIYDKEDNSIGEAFAYEKEQDKDFGTEFVFMSLTGASAITRTSAFFTNLTFKQLAKPEDGRSDYANLETDLLNDDREARLVGDEKTGSWQLNLHSTKTGKTDKLRLACHVNDRQTKDSGQPVKPKKELPAGPPAIPSEVELKSRYDGVGDYETTATYSFRFMTHDMDITRNNWDLLFEARKDFKEDALEVNTVTDDDSFIWALESGKNGCEKVDPCEIEKKRLLAKEKTGTSTRGREASSADVKNGQCYLVVSQDSDGSVTAMFEAKDHVKAISMKIHKIKVLDTPAQKTCN
jgi:hypothetical protein